MRKMLLIDGNSLLHRAFHALPPLRTSKGVHTNAVYGFINMLFRILQEEKPDYITVAFDKKGPTFRHTEYAAYKATRPKTAEELIGQFDLLKNILDALRIKFFEVDGFEADDILGTLSKKGEEAGVFSVIVTGDKDALQLVSPNTSVMLTKKGISELEIYDTAKVKERYGISPELIADMKGLMGDKSDNIPGVPGIGEKTAIKLIKEFGSVDNVLKNIDKLKGKLRENLEKYSEDARVSKHLATIVTDVSLDFSFEDIGYCEPDYETLINLFRELEFYSLIERVKPTDFQDKPAAVKPVKIHNAQDLQKLAAEIKAEKHIAVHADAKLKDAKSYEIEGIYLSVKDKCYFIDPLVLDDRSLLTELKSILEDGTIYKIAHDGKLLRKVLGQLDIDFVSQFDTMLAAYLLEPSQPRYDISTLVMEYLGKNLNNAQDLGEKTLYLHKLKEVLDSKIKDYKMEKLFYHVEMPLSVVLADMEITGIKVNTEKLKELGAKFGEKLKHLTGEIYNQAGMEFNINSPKQLGEVLFEKLSLPVIKRTKTGYSTDAEVLEKLRPSHPIVENILEYRFLMKMKSTYADGLLALVDKETERIYTNFNQTVTTTGRISRLTQSAEYSCKTEEGRHIRGVLQPIERDMCFYLGIIPR